ncbi:MAG: hypothetical protein UW11_C0023G0024 [Parcubacteria group bacterium GW2011_GWA2_43_9b]|nr:MAG: hypothetical protein UW11_C0023G0024 [Parcubacteria group bacterium GW2011_GWA2_43_9b]
MTKRLIDGFKKYAAALIGFSAIIWVLFFSWQTLTTRPRLWTDESINIEMARNFSLFGKLDVIVKPGVFSGHQAILQSTGYPVTASLALFFKLFGFGAVQARVYMLIWMALLLLLLLVFVKKVFGAFGAPWTILLIAGLAPFYANGRSVMGEIPGFIFLLLGVYFLWYRNDNRFISGVFFGLAAVARPSVYLLLLPALALGVFLQKDRPVKRLLSVGSGMILPVVGWLLLAMPDPLALSEWAGLVSFYKNPFGGMSVWGNMSQNFFWLFQHSTLLYFNGLVAVIMAAIFLNHDFYGRHKNFLNFFIAYYIFALLYFLKSPGWLRYIIAGQLLVLAVLPPAWAAIIDKLKFKEGAIKKALVGVPLLFLIILQLFHLLYRSDLFYSETPQKVAEFINAQPADKTVGIINAPIVSALINPAGKWQIIKLLGLPVLGENPLALPPVDLPDLIVSVKGSADFKEYENVAQEHYLLLKSIGEYDIYELFLGGEKR